jgi:RHS repeat-associated protein
MKRFKAPALVLCAAFVSASVPWRASAQESSPAARVAVEPSTPADKTVATAKAAPVNEGERQQVEAAPTAVASAPVGGDKTGVSSQAIALPQGAGKIQGMGESFSTQMSTGVATFTVPFALPDARGGAQPSLTLAYSSGAGHGLAGVGWDVAWPYIARQTDRGLPGYDDRAQWHPQQDRFLFDGGQEIVPICVVQGTSCAASLPAGEVMPAWADGWQYFRPRVEGSYQRIFWSPDHRTWRVQAKSGESIELGVPLDGSGYTGAVEADPASPAHVFRWNLVRQYDDEGTPPPAGAAAPAPVNAIVYRYLSDGGIAYLSDIYATPPAASPANAPLSAYAQHTHLVYENRPDPTISFRRGWRVDQALRLAGVDVTSVPFAAGGARHAVRRYHLAYDASLHVSLLSSVQVEGRCSGSESSAPAEDPTTQALPAVTGCPALPPMTFGYQHVTPFAVDGSPGVADLPGYEGFDERVIPMKQSPPSSVDENLADLFDINSDGLPDLVVTTPGKDAKFPFYLNGAAGARDTFAAMELGVRGVLGATASSLRLSNDNVAVSDIDGDGTIDWLHQPAPRSYAIYTPKLLADGWSMVGRAVPAATLQDPRLDLGEDTPDIDVFDANGDGLVDVVRATGAQMQTFFSLGRYPGGDGSFGSAQWTGPATASLSLTFVPACLPLVAPGVPLQFSDPSVRLGDMNGDGLTDIVYFNRGDIRYWPSRGDGSWGTGPLGACSNGFAEDTFIPMASSPEYSGPDASGLRLDDVNGDGLDDLVQVRFDAVDIWLNVDGTGFTPQRHTIAGVQPAQGPLWSTKVRIADVNGSGTRDILWGEAGRYRYIDLLGATRPWVLTHVDNGLGKTTDIEYTTSTTMMLAAEAAGQPWASKAPMPLHVVQRSTERDNLEIVGRPPGQYVTEYTYRDPVYDGRQREFRGFRSAVSRRAGDANSPTSTTASQFLLGECADDEAPPGGLASVCSPEGRWADNPREALKGLVAVAEIYDENGRYLSTAHHRYTLRKLYAGIDGRAVRVAFESDVDTWSYGAAEFTPSPTPQNLVDVVLDSSTATSHSASLVTTTVRALKGTAHLVKTTAADPFGNPTDAFDEGCVDGDACSTPDGVIHATTRSALAPGDASGWLWRTAESSVDGLTPGEKRKHLTMTYDANGRLTMTQGELLGSLPLDRFHETGAATAGNAAPNASIDGTITVAQTAYDAFGNALARSVPDGRCSAMEYASDYADLAVREHVYVGAAGGGTCGVLSSPRGANDLSITASYDRGLGLATNVVDLHGEHTRAEYDDHGRLARLWKPSPTTLGATSPAPSVIVDYDIASPTRPYSIIHTQTQEGPTDADAVYRDTYAYVDGLGRAIVNIDAADPVTDGHAFIVEGLTEYDNKGAKRRAYLQWFWDGDPRAYPLAQAPSTPSSTQRYDAFGRPVQSYGLDGALILQSVYHALSVDKWDAADLSQGPHAGTYASARQDGHGRAVSVIERVHAGGGIEVHETRTDFLPTGEPYRITRTRGKGDDVVRWLRYDTLGRVVLNVEPDTTKGFTASVTADPGSFKAWRYAYDDAGELVGMSDARGCGSDYYYDAGGRILVEDYSPCTAAQEAYSRANADTGAGAEVYYQYDAVPASLSGQSTGNTFDTCTVDPALQNGRLVAVSDRAARTVTGVDGRGRATCVARQLAKPGIGSPADRYAPAWFSRAVAYDGADRPVNASTGAKVLVDPQSGVSVVHTEYTNRGTVKRVASSYGAKDATGWADLVSSVTHDADGLMTAIVYGDAAHTTTAISYDGRRRLSSVQTYRGAPAIWTAQPPAYSPAPQFGAGAPTTFQLLLEDTDYVYDAVDNPVEIRDWRNPSEWPAGAEPVSRKIRYDDLYRVTRTDYQVASGTDAWTDPFYAEDSGQASEQDPRRGKPSPHLGFATRPLWQTYSYDWLGNTTQTDDDAKGFYDRSLGTINNGAPAAQPYQLKTASGGAAPRDGAVTTAYDDAGNLVGLSVVRNAGAPCLPAGAPCSQRFAYAWDEVGRLVRARRWDGAGLGVASDPLPSTPAAVELGYAYDAADARRLKTATDGSGVASYTAYVFDSLELRGAPFDGTNYVDTTATEVPYLFAHDKRIARVHFASTDVPTASSGQTHVLLELTDVLGSSTGVVDRETSELVERSTYMPYGATESDYRPARWDSFRESYGFTGKEDDTEVGLTYFGKRFLAPVLQRWLSPDPLAVHGLQADLNVYAYVHGKVFVAIDPTGLGDDDRPKWTPQQRQQAQARAEYVYGGTDYGNPDAGPIDIEHAIGRGARALEYVEQHLILPADRAVVRMVYEADPKAFQRMVDDHSVIDLLKDINNHPPIKEVPLADKLRYVDAPKAVIQRAEAMQQEAVTAITQDARAYVAHWGPGGPGPGLRGARALSAAKAAGGAALSGGMIYMSAKQAEEDFGPGRTVKEKKDAIWRWSFWTVIGVIVRPPPLRLGAFGLLWAAGIGGDSGHPGARGRDPVSMQRRIDAYKAEAEAKGHWTPDPPAGMR